MTNVKENLNKIFDEIKNGNNLNEPITLVGAIKMVDVDTINFAVSNGLEIVAENKVQDFRDKYQLIKGAKQHFIGRLQTNKVKYLVGNVDVIQSVDSLHLAEEISKRAQQKNVVQNIFLEINIGNDPNKGGINAESAIYFAEQIKKLPNINIIGLMSVLPICDNEDKVSKFCLQMREIYDTLLSQGFALKHLSVGMTNDYAVAIRNGSNMIRLGSAIFGKRNYGENK